MDVKERVLTSRIVEEANRNPSLAWKVGLDCRLCRLPQDGQAVKNPILKKGW